MTTPEDQKAEKCPFCESEAVTDGSAAICSNIECELFTTAIPLSQWNTRPREKAWESQLKEAIECLTEICKPGCSMNHDNGETCDDLNHEPCDPCLAKRVVDSINAALEEKR